MIVEAFEALCDACGVDIDDIDFVDEETTNVYRTEDFIVSQHIAICADGLGCSRILSEDKFYSRTKLRDMLYEKVFADDGKRLHSTMYVRTYID